MVSNGIYIQVYPGKILLNSIPIDSLVINNGSQSVYKKNTLKNRQKYRIGWTGSVKGWRTMYICREGECFLSSHQAPCKKILTEKCFFSFLLFIFM